MISRALLEFVAKIPSLSGNQLANVSIYDTALNLSPAGFLNNYFD